MRKTRGAALLAATALAVSGLAACGDEGEPAGSSSTASPSAVGRSSSESSGSESSSSSTPAKDTKGLPGDFPTAAKERTKEGAAAFGKYYLLEFGDATHTGDTSAIEYMDASDCLVCSNGVEDIQTDAEKGFTRNKNPYTVSQVKATKRPDEGYKVSMEVEVAAHHRLDSSGEPNGDIKATSYTMTQHVVWTDGQWRMSDWVAT